MKKNKFYILGIKGVLGTHCWQCQLLYLSSVFPFRLLVGAGWFGWPGKRLRCREFSQLLSLKNKIQGKESVSKPSWKGEITYSWRLRVQFFPVSHFWIIFIVAALRSASPQLVRKTRSILSFLSPKNCSCKANNWWLHQLFLTQPWWSKEGGQTLFPKTQWWHLHIGSKSISCQTSSLHS